MAGCPAWGWGFLAFWCFAILSGHVQFATGLTALTGTLLLWAIAIPTIVLFLKTHWNNDAWTYLHCSLALGVPAGDYLEETVTAARSGILMLSCRVGVRPLEKRCQS